MEKLLPRFNLDMDVYGYKYDLKVIACIERSPRARELEDYEDMAIVAEAIVNYWGDGRSADEDELYEQNGWLEIQSREEDGYVQLYAERVIDDFIDAYLEVQRETKR